MLGHSKYWGPWQRIECIYIVIEVMFVPGLAIKPINHLKDYDASCQKCQFRGNVIVFMTVGVTFVATLEFWRE